MAEKIGTLSDRIANRLVRHFQRPTLSVRPDVPIVSFTFDDAPVGALTLGADLVEAGGGHATYYVAGSMSDTVIDDVRMIDEAGYAELVARGHELASHTFAHRKLAAYSGRELERDLTRNEHWLNRLDARNGPRNFAIPYTMAHPLAQQMLRRHFLTSRGGLYGINRDSVDPHYLKSIELRRGTELSEITKLFDALERSPGWLILFTHDISESGRLYAYPPDLFGAVVTAAAKRGFALASIDGALDLLGARKQLTAALDRR